MNQSIKAEYVDAKKQNNVSFELMYISVTGK